MPQAYRDFPKVTERCVPVSPPLEARSVTGMMSDESILDSNECRELHAFAEDIAEQTRALVLDLWQQSDVGARLKEDNTPVTEVDLQAEQLARKLIAERYPNHGVIGEEFESINPASDYQWTLDPIDGTQNLVNRIPTFGTLIGLRFKKQAVVGIIDHPALNLRCSGGLGLGVSLNGAAVTLEDLPGENFSENDLIATNNIGVFARESGGEEIFQRIISVHPHTRIYYDCYAHTLGVTGSVAIVVEPNLHVWDLTPAEVLTREAGGAFRYFDIEQDRGDRSLYNAVFGKPMAVEIMLQHLA